ncbi:helix-turn-helix domain-containing protein [Nocardia thailandica]|uniref:helix-turn-helix domain-containing protein n=1 Tax=Nocardia thailandica TaxID=257275 RepID=UPI0002F6C94C|nr:helix-turn-helix domain-containing protein [Nocardia thailandica]
MCATDPSPFTRPAPPSDENWFSSVDLAARWHLPVKTIACWASAGTGPRYTRMGRHRRYRLADIRAWEHHHLNSHHTP